MAYDEELAARMRESLLEQPELTEQKMFGGLAFMIGGNLAVGAGSGGDMLVRVAHGDVAGLLDGDRVKAMEMRGRPMAGWLLVSKSSVASEEGLTEWIARGVDYASSLPAKPAKSAKDLTRRLS